MKTLKQILFLPNILVAILFGLLFYLFDILRNVAGGLFFGWLKLTSIQPKPENVKENG